MSRAENRKEPGPVPPERVVPPAYRPFVPIRPEHLYKTVGLFFLLLILYSYFQEISRILLVIYASVILAIALNVVVRVFPVQRRIVAVLLGLVIFAGIAGALWLVVPMLASQLRGLMQELPQLQAEMAAWTEWLETQTGFDLAVVGERGQAALGQFFEDAEILGQAVGLLEVLFLPLVIIIGALYAVAKPNERLLSPLLRAVPRDRRLAFRRLFELLAIRLRAWVKGTLISMLVVGSLTALGLSLLGVQFALLLGLISGVLEIVPIVGPWVGGVLAVGVTFIDDPSKAVWVALLMLAIQQLESNLITPLVMASVAEVHPFVTLFAIFLFGSLFGFLGVILALPLVFLVWTVIEVLWVERTIDTDEDTIEPVVKE